MNNWVSFVPFRKRSLFLVWGPPSLGPRSQVFARELGIEEVHFIYSTTRRGLLMALVKYGYQAIRTLILLFQKRPTVVFVQSPPSLAVLFVYLYCVLMAGHYVVDAHSAAFQHLFWTHPKWLYHFLARQAVATIVTNEEHADLISQWGGTAFILRDIPTDFPRAESYPLYGDFNVAVVNTYSPDEPLAEVLTAAEQLGNIQFYVTGKKQNAVSEFLTNAPPNIHFTDFLPDEAYYALLASSDAVICLTTRNHTMQRGACEALSLGRPIVTSNWPVLRQYFHKGTVHVPNTSEGIRQGILKLQQHYETLRVEIQELQIAQRQEWQKKVTALTRLIEQALKEGRGVN